MSVRFLQFLVTSLAFFAAAATRAEPRTIVFFGDSLTAGYGLASPNTDAYPALVQQKIDAAQLDYRVVNDDVGRAAAEVARLAH